MLGGVEFTAGVGQQPEQRQAEHESSHKAHRDLQARVRQADQRGQHAAGHGGEQGQQTGKREEKKRRKDGATHGNAASEPVTDSIAIASDNATFRLRP